MCSNNKMGIQYLIWNSFPWQRTAVMRLAAGEMAPPFDNHLLPSARENDYCEFCDLYCNMT